MRGLAEPLQECLHGAIATALRSASSPSPVNSLDLPPFSITRGSCGWSASLLLLAAERGCGVAAAPAAAAALPPLLVGGGGAAAGVLPRLLELLLAVHATLSACLRPRE